MPDTESGLLCCWKGQKEEIREKSGKMGKKDIEKEMEKWKYEKFNEVISVVEMFASIYIYVSCVLIRKHYIGNILAIWEMAVFVELMRCHFSHFMT